jgi:hypothetical protein
MEPRGEITGVHLDSPSLYFEPDFLKYLVGHPELPAMRDEAQRLKISFWDDIDAFASSQREKNKNIPNDRIIALYKAALKDPEYVKDAAFSDEELLQKESGESMDMEHTNITGDPSASRGVSLIDKMKVYNMEEADFQQLMQAAMDSGADLYNYEAVMDWFRQEGKEDAAAYLEEIGAEGYKSLMGKYAQAEDETAPEQEPETDPGQEITTEPGAENPPGGAATTLVPTGPEVMSALLDAFEGDINITDRKKLIKWLSDNKLAEMAKWMGNMPRHEFYKTVSSFFESLGRARQDMPNILSASKKEEQGPDPLAGAPNPIASPAEPAPEAPTAEEPPSEEPETEPEEEPEKEEPKKPLAVDKMNTILMDLYIGGVDITRRAQLVDELEKTGLENEKAHVDSMSLPEFYDILSGFFHKLSQSLESREEVSETALEFPGGRGKGRSMRKMFRKGKKFMESPEELFPSEIEEAVDSACGLYEGGETIEEAAKKAAQKIGTAKKMPEALVNKIEKYLGKVMREGFMQAPEEPEKPVITGTEDGEEDVDEAKAEMCHMCGGDGAIEKGKKFIDCPECKGTGLSFEKEADEAFATKDPDLPQWMRAKESPVPPEQKDPSEKPRMSKAARWWIRTAKEIRDTMAKGMAAIEASKKAKNPPTPDEIEKMYAAQEAEMEKLFDQLSNEYAKDDVGGTDLDTVRRRMQTFAAWTGVDPEKKFKATAVDMPEEEDSKEGEEDVEDKENDGLAEAQRLALMPSHLFKMKESRKPPIGILFEQTVSGGGTGVMGAPGVGMLDVFSYGGYLEKALPYLLQATMSRFDDDDRKKFTNLYNKIAETNDISELVELAGKLADTVEYGDATQEGAELVKTFRFMSDFLNMAKGSVDYAKKAIALPK